MMQQSKKVKIYLSNTTAITYPIVRAALMPLLSKIEYVYNPKANDMVIDCQYLTSEKMCLAKMELFKDIETKYKQINNLRPI